MKSHKDDNRTLVLEISVAHINESLTRIEKRFDKTDGHFRDIHEEFRDLRKEIIDIHKTFASHGRWIMGTGITILAAIAGIAAKLFIH